MDEWAMIETGANSVLNGRTVWILEVARQADPEPDRLKHQRMRPALEADAEAPSTVDRHRPGRRASPSCSSEATPR